MEEFFRASKFFFAEKENHLAKRTLRSFLPPQTMRTRRESFRTCGTISIELQGKISSKMQLLRYPNAWKERIDVVTPKRLPPFPGRCETRSEAKEKIQKPNNKRTLPDTEPQGVPQKVAKGRQMKFVVKTTPPVDSHEQDTLDAQLTRFFVAANLPFQV